MTLTVGGRLRGLRDRAGISQRELARRSGQSPAAISAIELDKVSPSIETLKRLLDSLGETLADFFSVGGLASEASFFGPQDMVEVQFGPICYRQVRQSFADDGVQFVRTTVQPGSDTGSVTHHAEDGEIGYVLSGQIEVTIDQDRRLLGPGEGYIVRGNQQIRVRNISAAPADYVFVSSPSGVRTILHSSA